MYYTAILCHKLLLLVLVRLKILIVRSIAIKFFNRSAALIISALHYRTHQKTQQ